MAQVSRADITEHIQALTTALVINKPDKRLATQALEAIPIITEYLEQFTTDTP